MMSSQLHERNIETPGERNECSGFPFEINIWEEETDRDSNPEQGQAKPDAEEHIFVHENCEIAQHGIDTGLAIFEEFKTQDPNTIDNQHDDRVYARHRAIRSIEKLVLSLLTQLADVILLASRSELISIIRGENCMDVVFELSNRSRISEDTKHRKTIRFPGNARNVKSSQKLVLNYIHEALVTGIPSTKRDIFYRDVKLFKQQSTVDMMTDDLAATFGLRRCDLQVRCSTKGLFCSSCLKLVLQDGSRIYGNDHEGTLIPAGEDIVSIELDEATSWILVVEKEAVFHTLCHEGFTKYIDLPGPGIIITGKGYPDIATRELVHMLSNWVPDTIPCLALMDSDPHGLDILSVYKYGSQSLQHEGEHLESPKLKWIGLSIRESSFRMGITRDSLLPLSVNDNRKALSMLKRSREIMPKRWRRELSYMLHIQRKAEIELLSDVATGQKHIPLEDGTLLEQSLGDQVPLNSSGCGKESFLRYLTQKLAEKIVT